MSYVIVGDGIAGSSAAEAIREADVESDVTVITDEGEALYNRILIKEFAKGKLPEAPISIHDPDWYEERDIDLELNTHVTEVDPDAHEIHTHDGDTYEYDKLLIATGGTPAQLPVENSDADGIHHFWTFQDARGIKQHAAECDNGLVVGAGLLGIDLAAICAAHGIDAHYLMRGDCWWRYALSEEGAEIIHEALEANGVTPVFNSGVDRFETDEDGHLTAAIDPNGDRYEADFCGIAIGLDFNTEWLQGSGIERDNGIIVDEYMQTNVEDIYAAGDVTRFHDTILGEQAQNGAWGSAKEQGATAAKNMVADSVALRRNGRTAKPSMPNRKSSAGSRRTRFPTSISPFSPLATPPSATRLPNGSTRTASGGVWRSRTASSSVASSSATSPSSPSTSRSFARSARSPTRRRPCSPRMSTSRNSPPRRRCSQQITSLRPSAK
jgi:NAD(P)H-nitrite reductase large subunit